MSVIYIPTEIVSEKDKQMHPFDLKPELEQNLLSKVTFHNVPVDESGKKVGNYSGPDKTSRLFQFKRNIYDKITMLKMVEFRNKLIARISYFHFRHERIGVEVERYHYVVLGKIDLTDDEAALILCNFESKNNFMNKPGKFLLDINKIKDFFGNYLEDFELCDDLYIHENYLKFEQRANPDSSPHILTKFQPYIIFLAHLFLNKYPHILHERSAKFGPKIKHLCASVVASDKTKEMALL
ncbi:MAG: hypothetical protein Satyrvirus1_40 [Satyrvirus sp.]|uniref:Uncharacterized protein n=1 Tax=Satyrvirus sp. TaxID=2487771 RepID=A0A3G5AED0_9VIRU|nr:MAG: hypothetical protein Satyrvirus1_40 [Satyrvirus sp.]